MSRHLPAQPAAPTTLLSSHPLPASETHALLSSYLLSKSTSQPWSHSHDAGTTASLRKLELSLRGINGPDANTHLTTDSAAAADDAVSRVDTDEGSETERRRVYETVESLEDGSASDDGLQELQDVKRDDDEEQQEEYAVAVEAEGMDVATEPVDKEERKRLKKLRHKEEKRRKEAERRAGAE
ncbi:hypothetical protein Dda_3270 [Drechslerella dactyloides]|uniref:Uncharacterized protein n=1 Tax=Drechslerella dactyloides TaxID=74499 RepID=A0AAD6NLD1_DREDA|nr:hypothetical protein Dda_3270 [Drechslerella dactyloides]